MTGRWAVVRGGLAATLAAVVVTWTAGAADAAAEPLARPAGATIFELDADADQVPVTVPITLAAGVRIGQVRVRLTDVTYEGRYGAGLPARFRVDPSLAMAGGQPAVLLTVILADPKGDDLRAGNYTVRLALTRTGRAGPEPASLEIVVVHPAGELRVPSTLFVERTKAVLFWHARTEQPSLLLQETAGKSRLTDLTVEQVEPLRVGAKASTGELRFADVQPVPADDKRRVNYSLTGSFPLGTGTAALEVDAPQLAAPVSVPVQVRTRWHPILIPLVVLAGLLVGLLTRSILTRWIQLRQAQVTAIDELARLQKAESHPDTTFSAAVQQARQALEAAKDGDLRHEQLAEEVEKADASHQDALLDLAERTGKVKAELEQTEQLTTTPGSFPHAIRTALAEAATDLPDVANLVEAQNATGARARLDEIEGRLVKALRTRVGGWRKGLRSALEAIGTPTAPPLPDETEKRLRSAIEVVQTRLGAAELVQLDPSSAQLLEGVHATRQAIDDLLHQLRLLPEYGKVLAERLQTAKEQDPVETLERAAEELEKVLAGNGQAADDPAEDTEPEDILATAAARLTTLLEAMHAAITKQGFYQRDDKVRERIDPLLATGRYLEAAAEIAPPKPSPAPDDQTLLSAGETIQAFTDRVEEFLAHLRPGTPLGRLGLTGRSVVSLVVAPTRPPLEVAKARALRDLLLGKTVQTALLAVVLTIVAFLLFSPNFDGTFVQVAAIFLWAFALDVTVDVAVEQASGAAGR